MVGPRLYQVKHTRSFVGFKDPVTVLSALNSYLDGSGYNYKIVNAQYSRGRKRGIHVNHVQKYKLHVAQVSNNEYIVTLDYYCRKKISTAVGVGTLSVDLADAEKFVYNFWTYADKLAIRPAIIVSMEKYQRQTAPPATVSYYSVHPSPPPPQPPTYTSQSFSYPQQSSYSSPPPPPSYPPPPYPSSQTHYSQPPPYSSQPPCYSSQPPPYSSQPPPYSSQPPSYSSQPPPYTSPPPPYSSQPQSYSHPTYSPQAHSYSPSQPTHYTPQMYQPSNGHPPYISNDTLYTQGNPNYTSPAPSSYPHTTFSAPYPPSYQATR